jgi:hypothetical protein
VRARAVAIAVVVLAGCVVAGGPKVLASRLSPASSTRLYGVSVFIDNSERLPDSAVVANAEKLFSYVAGLGANSVSLNFPFYMNGLTDSEVFPEVTTPSPSLMRALIALAQAHGLAVQLRPLIEINGGKAGAWRGIIEPANVGEWFGAYWDCLEPYAVVAAQTNVTSFSIGAELNSLVADAPSGDRHGAFGWNNDLPHWAVLIQKMRSIIGDRLLYSASRLAVSTIPGIAFGYDEYKSLQFTAGQQPTSATPSSRVVNEFAQGIEETVHRSAFPALSSVFLEEVDIGAYVGAWTTPWQVDAARGTPVARWVQSDWDTAMCDVFQRNDMAALYFWSVNLPGFSAARSKANENSFGGFVGTGTSSAIAACFAHIRAGTP